MISVLVVPEAARHADPGLANDKLADLIANGLSPIVHDVRGDAWRRPGERRGLERREDVAGRRVLQTLPCHPSS